MDCEMEVTENNHYLFDFDHRPGVVKLYNVAQMRTASDKKFREEIAKCDLVCLFDHRERTMSRLRARVIPVLEPLVSDEIDDGSDPTA
jgi:hypothetical protein